MPDPAGDPVEARLRDVVAVGGWASVAVGLLLASTSNAVFQILAGLVSGPPELDAEGLQLLVNVFVLTAPLAIAVTILAFTLLRAPDLSGLHVIGVGLIAIGAGVVLGNVLYSLAFQSTLVVDVRGLTATLADVSGPWYVYAVAAIGWFLVGYYELFGIAHFVAAFIAGGFAGYAGHRMLGGQQP